MTEAMEMKWYLEVSVFKKYVMTRVYGPNEAKHLDTTPWSEVEDGYERFVDEFDSREKALQYEALAEKQFIAVA